MLDSQHNDPSNRGRLAEIELAFGDVGGELLEHGGDHVAVQRLQVQLAAGHELERPREGGVALSALGADSADPGVPLREVHQPDGLPVGDDLLHPVEELADGGVFSGPLIAEPQEERTRRSGVVGDEADVQRPEIGEGRLELGVVDVLAVAARLAAGRRGLEHPQLLQRRVAHLVDADPLLAGQHLRAAVLELDLGPRGRRAEERPLRIVEHLLATGLPAGPAEGRVAVRQHGQALLTEELTEVTVSVSHDTLSFASNTMNCSVSCRANDHRCVKSPAGVREEKILLYLLLFTHWQ